MTGPDETAPDPVAQLARRASRTLSRRLSPGGQVTLVAAALILIQLALRTWATSGSWFMWDDYIFLADVARGDANAAWLVHSHFSLVMPFSLLLVKLVGDAGLDWGVIATQMIALQAVASLMCWWMLRTVFGNRKRLLIPLAFYLFSPLTVPATVWWSVAINQYPHHIAIFGAITAHVTYLRSGKLRYAFLTTAFLVLGLASYIKAPLIVIVLVVTSGCWFTSGSWRQRGRQLVGSWPAWALYAAATVGYILIWRQQQAGSTPRQTCELPGSLTHSLIDSLGTSVVGGPWRWKLWTGGIDPFIAASNCVPQSYRGDPNLLVGGAPQSLLSPPLIGLLFAWLLIAALTTYLWARHRGALTSLWFLLPYAALSAALVYLGRAGTFGSQVSAREVRYFSDVAAVLSFAIGTAIMPILGASRWPEPRTPPWLLVKAPRRAFVAIGVIGLIGSFVSTITYVEPWHRASATSFPERVFVENVRRQIEKRPDDAPVIEIVDAPLPVTVANPVIFPYNLPSRKLAPLGDRLRAVTAGTDLSILDAEGNIQMASVPDAPRAKPGPVKGCGYLAQQNGRTIPIVPVVNLPWWIRIDYLAGADGEVEIRAGETIKTVPVKKGLHTLYAQTAGAYDHVWLRPSGTLSVCVDNVHVGIVGVKGSNQ